LLSSLQNYCHIHLYNEYTSSPTINLDKIVKGIEQVLPNCIFEIHDLFPGQALVDIEQTRISELKQPFDRQPRKGDQDFDVNSRQSVLYDGFELQQLLSESLRLQEDVHVIFTDLLTCTFSEDDWRYHARALICGTPSLISLTGIVEGPAKPRDFYISQLGFVSRRTTAAEDIDALKNKFAGRFIDNGDKRMNQVATGYLLQAIFFFATKGEPFCESNSCRLYNAHWQEDLIRTQVDMPLLCSKHKTLANKFNLECIAKERI
jgi:hypothetical protein